MVATEDERIRLVGVSITDVGEDYVELSVPLAYLDNSTVHTIADLLLGADFGERDIEDVFAFIRQLSIRKYLASRVRTNWQE